MRSTVADVMTRHVIMVSETGSYKNIVGLIRDNDVSGLPVVRRDGSVVGIVTEGDLILKQERYGHERRRSILRSRDMRTVSKKMAASVARDLMTSPAITIRPDAPLAEAARLMHRHAIKSLPVVDDAGRLAGIVSRKDLLKVFERSDEAIKREVVEDVLHNKLWLTPEDASIRVDVDDGVVCLEGWVDRKSLLQIIIDTSAGVEGVVVINNRLSFKTDDTDRRAQLAPPWGVLPQALRRP